MEVVVENTKGGSSRPRLNLKTALTTTKKKVFKQEGEEFIVIELENKQRAFQCDICFKIFKDRSKLKVHREIHTSERNVLCLVSVN